MLNTYEKFDDCQFMVSQPLVRGLHKYMMKKDLEVDENLFLIIKIISDLKIPATGWLRTVDMIVNEIIDFDIDNKKDYTYFVKMAR